MTSAGKVNKLLSTHRNPDEAHDWIFSLIPIGVAFGFYMMFIMSSDIQPKGLFIAYGAAAGIIGLESYWIVRGWQKNHASTVVMGVIGIAITLILLSLYVSVI